MNIGSRNLKCILPLLCLVLLSETVCAASVRTLPIPRPNKLDCVALISRDPRLVVHSESKDVEIDHIQAADFRKLIRNRGPFQQSMAALMTPGNPTVFGTRKGVDRFRNNLGALKDALFDFTLLNGQDKKNYRLNDQNVSVQLAPALTGSALIQENYSDLDAEITLVVKSEDFHHEDFYIPDSPMVMATEAFIRDHISTNLEKGYTFSDFKAGEYDFIPKSAESTMSRSIKWDLEDIKRGYKLIPAGREDGPLKQLTLREALASQSRVKVDWIAKVATPVEFSQETGISKRYIEISVLVVLAGQRKNGTPVLKINNETQFPALGATGAHIGTKGSSSHLPVRITSAFFDIDHAELARQASISTPPPDIRYLNTVVINAIKTYYRKQNYLKILKLISTRLFYWNDYKYFQKDSPNRAIPSSSLQIRQEVTAILCDPLVKHLKALYEVGEGLEMLPGPLKRKDEFRKYMDGVNRSLLHFGLIRDNVEFQSLKDAIQFIFGILSSEVHKRITKVPDLKEYIDYILGFEYANQYETYSSVASFSSYTLPNYFRDEYTKSFARLVKEYPHLKITRPDDLHMTLAYNGQLAVSKIKVLRELTDEFSKKMKRYPVNFSGGVLRIVGRTNSQIAIVFPVEQLPPEVLDLISDYKSAIYKLGIMPDEHDLDEFLPHISLAHVRDAYHNPESHLEISTFLMEDLDGLSQIRLNGDVNLLEVADSTNGSTEQNRYRSIQPGEEEQVDLSTADVAD